MLPCFSINHIMEIFLASLEFSSQKKEVEKEKRKIDNRQGGKRFAKARNSVRWHLSG